MNYFFIIRGEGLAAPTGNGRAATCGVGGRRSAKTRRAGGDSWITPGAPCHGPYQKSIFSSSQATRSSTGTSSCCMVSRSRTVTLPVSAVSKSTQMQ